MSAETEQLAASPAEHIAQFYGCDDELAAGVSSYLGEALEAGATAIVVATAAHRLAVEARLAAALDVAAARLAGSLVVLDAAEMMDLFLIGARPDPDGFELVIGGLIRQAVSTGRPVRVYGEMVSLLWDAGHVNAAIELEELWNELAGRLPFSLLCGYRAQSVSGREHTDALRAVCNLHAAVTGIAPPAPDRDPPAADDAAARTFVLDRAAPRAARHFVVDTLARWGERDLADDAAVVATELATNAVAHARCGFTISVARSAAAIRISVRDAGLVPAADGASPLVPSTGHGLGLVAALASQWAVQPLADGKMVWAEFRRKPGVGDVSTTRRPRVLLPQ
jgi:anti-sigma regulatory factor (Ser/Thr protein kinase)